MIFTNTYTRVALQHPSEEVAEYGIVRETPRGKWYSGSIHDWERNKNAQGVLKFPSPEEAEEYRREFVWEDDAKVEKLEEFPGADWLSD